MALSNNTDPSDLHNNNPVWHPDVIEYMADPLDKRTYEQFCNDIGISLMTFWRYRTKHRDQITREVEAVRRKFLSEMRSKAYKSLNSKIDKDVNALKLFFQLAGDLVERVENRTEILTPEDKKARIQAAVEKLLNEAEQSGQKGPDPKTEDSKSE